MDIDPHNLPAEASLLRQIVLQLLGVVEEKGRLLKRVQHQLQQLLRQRYGQKRERIDENQLFLFAAQIIADSQGRAASAVPEPPADWFRSRYHQPENQATQRPRPQTAARILGATPRGFRPERDPAAMSALPQGSAACRGSHQRTAGVRSRLVALHSRTHMPSQDGHTSTLTTHPHHQLDDVLPDSWQSANSAARS